MPAVTKFGSECSGHACWPPRPNIQGSPNVFVNGIAAHRQSDAWSTHCCGKSCHDGVLAAGSSTGLGELYACNSGSYQSLYWRLSFDVGAGAGVGFSPALDTSRHKLLVVYDGSGSTTVGAYQAWYDGSPVTLTASGNNGGLFGDTASVGCGVGGVGEPLYPADAEIEMWSVYDRVLTAGEVAAWNTAAGA